MRRFSIGPLVAVALATRLIDLGNRPMHHDEAQEAWIAWRLVDAGDFEYDPVWHGPLAYLLDAIAFLVLGVSDSSARVMAGLAGAALVATPWLLRARLGNVGALACSLLLLLSPSLLYYSRFSRNDMLVALLTVALVVVVDRFCRAPRRHHPALFGVLLAALFATKESAVIVVGLGLALLAAALVVDREAVAARLRAVDRRAYLYGAAAFAAVFALLFTTFGTDPGGLWRGIYDGPRYWLEQHDKGVGEKPWTYAQLLVLSEGPIVLIALAGALMAWRRRSAFGLACAFSAAALTGAYTFAGERFPWLITQPLIPLTLLAGLTVQWLWEQRRRAALAVAAVAVAAMGAGALDLAFNRPEDPRDIVVSVQTTREAEEVRDEVIALMERGARVDVDATFGGAWPWGWWLRDRGAGFPDMTATAYRPAADVLIVSRSARERLRPLLRGWRERAFVMRAFWRRDRPPRSPDEAWDYLVDRRPWSSMSGFPQWLYVRPGGVP